MKLFGIFSIFKTLFDGAKDALEPTIPAEYWANKDLIYQDRMSGMSEKEILKNVKRGRYVITVKYPEPHRNERGQFMIENDILWRKDLNEHGAVKTQKWVEQGKYNLTSSELKVSKAIIDLNWLEMCLIRRRLTAEEEIKKANCKKIIAESNIDWTKTEAVKLWLKAYNADLSNK